MRLGTYPNQKVSGRVIRTGSFVRDGRTIYTIVLADQLERRVFEAPQVVSPLLPVTQVGDTVEMDVVRDGYGGDCHIFSVLRFECPDAVKASLLMRQII